MIKGGRDRSALALGFSIVKEFSLCDRQNSSCSEGIANHSEYTMTFNSDCLLSSIAPALRHQSLSHVLPASYQPTSKHQSPYRIQSIITGSLSHKKAGILLILYTYPLQGFGANCLI